MSRKNAFGKVTAVFTTVGSCLTEQSNRVGDPDHIKHVPDETISELTNRFAVDLFEAGELFWMLAGRTMQVDLSGVLPHHLVEPFVCSETEHLLSEISFPEGLMPFFLTASLIKPQSTWGNMFALASRTGNNCEPWQLLCVAHNLRPYMKYLPSGWTIWLVADQLNTLRVVFDKQKMELVRGEPVNMRDRANAHLVRIF